MGAKILLTILAILACSTTISSANKCYTCSYVEDYSGYTSSKDCEEEDDLSDSDLKTNCHDFGNMAMAALIRHSNDTESFGQANAHAHAPKQYQGGNGPVSCYKLVGKFRAKGSDDEKKLVVRGCQYGTRDKCRDISVFNLNGGHVVNDATECHCDSEGCNSAFSTKSAPVFAFILLVVKYFL